MKTKLFLVVVIIIVLFVLGYMLLESYVKAMEFVGKAYGINVTNLGYLYDSAVCMVFYIITLVFIAVFLLLLFAVIREEDL